MSSNVPPVRIFPHPFAPALFLKRLSASQTDESNGYLDGHHWYVINLFDRVEIIEKYWIKKKVIAVTKLFVTEFSLNIFEHLITLKTYRNEKLRIFASREYCVLTVIR